MAESNGLVKEEITVKEEPLGLIHQDVENKSKTENKKVSKEFLLRFCEKSCKCIHCNGVPMNSSPLKIHLRKHTGENQDQYSHCMKGLEKSSTFEGDTRTNIREKTYKCSQCFKHFSKRVYLKKHMNIHTGVKPQGCSHNDEFSLIRSNMKTHNVEKPYQCRECDKTYTGKDELKEHLMTHSGEKPYGCGHCNKTFMKSLNLKIHLKTHTGEKPFSCSHCDVAFQRKEGLKRHLRIHNEEESDKPNKYLCSHCDKGFSIFGNLIRHLRAHNVDNPFKCSRCETVFRTSNNFTRHLKICTGRKKFRCSQCNKNFLFERTRKAHICPYAPAIPQFQLPNDDSLSASRSSYSSAVLKTSRKRVDPPYRLQHSKEYFHYPAFNPIPAEAKNTVGRGRRCQVCTKQGHPNKRTSYQCALCNMPLCVTPCFMLYHKFENYWEPQIEIQ